MSKQWAGEGARLIQFKAGMSKNHPSNLPAPANTGAYAYQSQPVNITGAGEYTLHFGPVNAAFKYPKSPISVVFTFPSDTKFVATPMGKIGIVTIDNKRYLQAGITISDFSESYCSFTGWIY